MAAKTGLTPEQKYWWLESWQKGEREAERDEREADLPVHLKRQRISLPTSISSVHENRH